MLGRADGLESDERHVHGEECAQQIEGAVGDVETMGVATDEQQHEHVRRDEINDEDVAAPRRHHVEVAEGAQTAPQHAAGLHGLHPQVEAENQGENRNGLVIVRAGNRTRNVA